MKTLSIAVAIVILAACAAQARLGETEAEIEKRYGKPKNELPAIPPSTKLACYECGGLKILVSFINGKSECEHYWHAVAGTIFRDEMAALLAANSAGMKWEEESLFYRWRRPDGGVALYCPDDKSLAIFSPAWFAAAGAARQKNLSGF